MTLIKDLITTLQARNPNAQVFLMTQRKQPFENHVAGVVGREEMADQQWRVEPGIAHDDVFLVVGTRIRPGSLSAWICAEHQATVPPTAAAPPAAHAGELVAATLSDIARQHLQIGSLDDSGSGAVGLHAVATVDLRRALEAAYLAGSSARHQGDAELEGAEQPAENEAE